MEEPSEGHEGAQPGSSKSNDNDKERKRKPKSEIDRDHRRKKKDEEMKIKMGLKTLENYNAELVRENVSLKQERAEAEEMVQDTYREIHGLIQGNNVVEPNVAFSLRAGGNIVGQNIDKEQDYSQYLKASNRKITLQDVDDNFEDVTGEPYALMDTNDMLILLGSENSSMNPQTLSPSAQPGRIARENSSMNPQVLSPSAQPGSSKITRKEKKREADKRCRDNKKSVMKDTEKTTEELKKTIVELEKDNAVIKGQIDLLLKTFKQNGAIKVALMNDKAAREEAAEQLLAKNLFPGSHNLTGASTSATKSRQDLPPGRIQASEEFMRAFSKYNDDNESIHAQELKKMQKAYEEKLASKQASLEKAQAFTDKLKGVFHEEDQA